MEENIILIGMPGAGKSTVGVVLAKTMGMKFIDSDLIIQERAGELLQSIIDRDGMDYFLEVEAASVMSIEAKGSVIATGGSVIYKEAAMKHLRSIGKVVYLSVAYEEITRRVDNITTRGIAIRDGATMKDIYEERQPLYKAYSDLSISCDGHSVEGVIEAIIQQLKA